ncbi:MAG: UTP--glucose-1-phosphate uridylyltransferase [Desulfobacterales bacterium]|jgi:UTP--glucose-1-phosphate uridylyltransferase|nr:UTP--glucose-1-phosphate uridylyltransferase [Desulfobacterales bacterium]
MPVADAVPNYLTECIEKMKAEGLSDRIINTFSFYYLQVVNGADGLLYEKDIEPLHIDEIEEDDCLAGCKEVGAQVMPRTVRIVLNGGLGTTMGLTRAKSLIHAKEGLSFLEILLAQADLGHTALCFMNSFSTHEDTCAEIMRIKPARKPRTFLQHKFPKISQKDFRPAKWPLDTRLEWNPPGHGDVYISLYSSGLLQQLLDEGIEYAFISNSDNLGAALNLRMLGYFSQHEVPFMLEVARRKPSDAKGGHLARHRNGRMILRETAQCPPTEKSLFQDINRYRFFNTNNIWINLSFLKTLIEKEGIVPLPLILNSKPLDPRDETSPPVYQVETAMGSAIFLFEGATAVCVPRSRFLPVKSCNDLLAIRSDRYLLTSEKSLVQNPNVQTESIQIDLDPRFFGRIDDFNRRLGRGTPSLLACDALSITGDVSFGKNVTIIGTVAINNPGPTPFVIPDDTILENELIQ